MRSVAAAFDRSLLLHDADGAGGGSSAVLPAAPAAPAALPSPMRDVEGDGFMWEDLIANSARSPPPRPWRLLAWCECFADKWRWGLQARSERA